MNCRGIEGSDELGGDAVQHKPVAFWNAQSRAVYGDEAEMLQHLDAASTLLEDIDTGAALELRNLQSRVCPEWQEEKLVGAFSGGEELDLAAGSAISLDLLAVTQGYRLVAPAHSSDITHCSCAETDVVGATPVEAIVHGLCTRAGPVGDFVVDKSPPGKLLAGK